MTVTMDNLISFDEGDWSIEYTTDDFYAIPLNPPQPGDRTPGALYAWTFLQGCSMTWKLRHPRRWLQYRKASKETW